MMELNGVAGWIYQRLISSSVITNFVGINTLKNVYNVYEGVAPQDAKYPLIVFAYIGGRNLTYTGNRRVFADYTYEIKAYDENPESFSNLAPIGDEIDTLFQQAQDIVDDVVVGCTPESPLQRIEVNGGIRRNCLGIRCTIMAYVKP